MRHLFFLFLLTLFLQVGLAAEPPAIPVPFSLNSLDGWNEKSFKDNTRYTLTHLNDTVVLQADSHDAASALFYKAKIDLRKTPYLNWRWRVEKVLEKLDEKTKAGDDYAARVYIVFKSNFFQLYPYSMSYIWSGSAKVNESWKNAYTDRVVMLALQNNNEFVGQWRNEKRNVHEDILKYFDQEISTIEGVAIMTDTDNSHQHVIAYYSNLYFSDQ